MKTEILAVIPHVVDLYIDWAYGRDEEVCQSDVIETCEWLGISYDEIKEIGDIEAKKLKL